MAAPAAAAAAAAVTSGSKRSLPGAAEDSERRVQPRHFHFGPNPAAASSASVDAAAAEADRPPPAARLYRHALESIFSFLTHRELAVALQVSRSWLAAAESMASLQLRMGHPLVPLRVVARSAVGRHVTHIGSASARMPLTADALFIVAHHMAHLRELNCEVNVTPSEGPLAFPPGLQTLRLQVTGDSAATIRTISRLPLLESLTLFLPYIDDQLSFTQLASLPQLRDLSVCLTDDNDVTEFSDAQVAELRTMPLLRRLDVKPMPNSLLRRLLAQPHELQWQDIELPSRLDDDAAALLPQLPSLTKLNAGCHVNATCSRFDFVRRLPNLTDVRITIIDPIASDAGRMESLVAGLQCCSRIEELTLFSKDVTSAHLAELLPRLPRLRTFSLGLADITTLSFLAQQPMAGQLSCLVLADCTRLPLTELRHVHALRALKSLSLIESFDAPMDTHCRSLYTPPSLLMPQLDKFTYDQPNA